MHQKDAQRLILQNLLRMRKLKRKLSRKGKRNDKISSLSHSSHIPSDSTGKISSLSDLSLSSGRKKITMRRKRNGGKTIKRRMKKKNI